MFSEWKRVQARDLLSVFTVRMIAAAFSSFAQAWTLFLWMDSVLIKQPVAYHGVGVVFNAIGAASFELAIWSLILRGRRGVWFIISLLFVLGGSGYIAITYYWQYEGWLAIRHAFFPILTAIVTYNVGDYLTATESVMTAPPVESIPVAAIPITVDESTSDEDGTLQIGRDKTISWSGMMQLVEFVRSAEKTPSLRTIQRKIGDFS